MRTGRPLSPPVWENAEHGELHPRMQTVLTPALERIARAKERGVLLSGALLSLASGSTTKPAEVLETLWQDSGAPEVSVNEWDALLRYNGGIPHDNGVVDALVIDRRQSDHRATVGLLGRRSCNTSDVIAQYRVPEGEVGFDPSLYAAYDLEQGRKGIIDHREIASGRSLSRVFRSPKALELAGFHFGQVAAETEKRADAVFAAAADVGCVIAGGAELVGIDVNSLRPEYGRVQAIRHLVGVAVSARLAHETGL